MVPQVGIGRMSHIRKCSPQAVRHLVGTSYPFNFHSGGSYVDDIVDVVLACYIAICVEETVLETHQHDFSQFSLSKQLTGKLLQE